MTQNKRKNDNDTANGTSNGDNNNNLEGDTSPIAPPSKQQKQSEMTVPQTQDDALKLYGLVGDADKPQGRLLSPHVWKTKLDLAYLGITHSQSNKTFPQIRKELSEHTKNPAVTVPTIEIDGKFVTDSWKIAEYLDSEFSTESKSLFPGGKAGKEFAKFIEIWSNTTLANELRPFVGSSIHKHFDKDSKEYFIKAKWGNDASKHEALVERLSNPEKREEQLSAARNRLTVIEALLGYKKEKREDLWLIGLPSHADFCLFGWYAASTLNPAVEQGVWRHEDLPLVAEWLDLVLSSGLVQKQELE